jgi:hypothetical protein
MILVNGRWKIRNPKTNRLVLTTSKLAKDIIREISPPIPNDCLEIIAKMIPLDVIKVSTFFRDIVTEQIAKAKLYGNYLNRYMCSALKYYYVHRKITFNGYDGHQLSIEFKDTTDNKRTFTITSSYDDKIYTFQKKIWCMVKIFRLRKNIPIDFARKINHILHNVKECTTVTYLKVDQYEFYNFWVQLGNQDGSYHLFDLTTLSNLPINQIDEQPWKEINDKYDLIPFF